MNLKTETRKLDAPLRGLSQNYGPNTHPCIKAVDSGLSPVSPHEVMPVLRAVQSIDKFRTNGIEGVRVG